MVTDGWVFFACVITKTHPYHASFSTAVRKCMLHIRDGSNTRFFVNVQQIIPFELLM